LSRDIGEFDPEVNNNLKDINGLTGPEQSDDCIASPSLLRQLKNGDVTPVRTTHNCFSFSVSIACQNVFAAARPIVVPNGGHDGKTPAQQAERVHNVKSKRRGPLL
jgi:hypothetical protein